jgi:hypothetical protein
LKSVRETLRAMVAMQELVRLAVMCCFVSWRLSAYLPSGWAPRWSWVAPYIPEGYDPFPPDPFTAPGAPGQGGEHAVAAVYDDDWSTPAPKLDPAVPLEWMSSSGAPPP